MTLSTDGTWCHGLIKLQQIGATLEYFAKLTLVLYAWRLTIYGTREHCYHNKPIDASTKLKSSVPKYKTDLSHKIPSYKICCLNHLTKLVYFIFKMMSIQLNIDIYVVIELLLLLLSKLDDRLRNRFYIRMETCRHVRTCLCNVILFISCNCHPYIYYIFNNHKWKVFINVAL